MKKVLFLLLAAAMAWWLMACQSKLVQSPYGEADFDASGAVTLATERSSYDISVESYTYLITNNTEETIQFTPDYMIEYQQDGQWYTLPRSEAYQEGSVPQNTTSVAPGETGSGSFSFWSYDFTVKEGTYRLIKPVGGLLCQAEFTIGPKDTGAEGGYIPLEQLPEELDLEELDCDLILDAAGAPAGGGEERVLDFFREVAQGNPAKLRMVVSTQEGDPIVCDVVFADNHFLYRQDATRDRYGSGGITQRRYSYLVTDGDALYLSDFASLSYADGQRTLAAGQQRLLEAEALPGGWGELTAAVEQMTERRLASDATMARYYSADGVYWVNLTAEPLDYTVTSRSYGMSRTLTELPEEAEGLEIVSAQWLSETQVQLNCAGGPNSQVWYAVFDLEAETVVSAGV